MKKSFTFLVLIIVFGWYQVSAQWTSDPAVNTRLSDLSGEQALPKIVVTGDGHTYISWFSMEDGNYNVRMQYLDPDGNPMWANNGLLVSDQPQMTWLTDYSLSMDVMGNAVVTFQDIRNVDNNPVAYCVSPEGTMLWGDNGVMLSNNANFEPNPVAAPTASGAMVFAWQSEATDGSELHLQKVSASGDMLWNDGIVLSSASEDYTSPFLQPAGGEQVFLIWHKASGPFWAPNRGLYVQLLDADGNFVWENEAEIYAPVPSGAVVYLKMCSDEAGGLIFAWYRNDTGLHFHSYVQHMDADGNVTMPAGGALVSTSTARNHMYPAVAFMSQTQEVMIYMSEQDMDQNQRGLYAQKLDLDGNRLWGDEGKTLIPLSNNDYSLLMAAGYPDKAIGVYEAYEFGNAADSKIQAVMLDAEGNYVWENQFVDMSTFQSSKVHPVLSPYFWGQWVCVWEDNRGGNTDIYAQNIQPDGMLGPVVTAVGNHPAEIRSVKAQPNPCTEVVTFDTGRPMQGDVSVSLFDPVGKCVLQRHFSPGDMLQLNTVSLRPGLYFYRIENAGETFTGKLIRK